jgi:hypothetical protein
MIKNKIFLKFEVWINKKSPAKLPGSQLKDAVNVVYNNLFR